MLGSLVARKMSVRPSVCLSVKHVNCDKTQEKSVQLIYHTEKKNGWWERPHLPEILGQPAP